MDQLTEDEIQKLRALLPQANAEEAAEIIEEATEIIDEETLPGNESPPDAEVIEEATEIIEEAAEIVEEEETHESVSEDSESGEPPPEFGADGAADASGESDTTEVVPIVDIPPAVSASVEYADEPPRASHWWYRPLGRR